MSRILAVLILVLATAPAFAVRFVMKGGVVVRNEGSN